MTFAEAIRVLAALEHHGVDYVLVGSMAMAAQGIVRATRDIDIFVSADESNIRRLKAALTEVFEDPAIDAISASDLAGEYPAIQYVPPTADYWIDILARLGKAFTYQDVDHEIMRVEGVSIRVATPRMLYRMKRDTVRPQDRLDAEVLKERFDLEDE
jgi:hypothetical protein